jgi:hypothetical protein
MDYPLMVFKGNGPYERESGTYDYKSVDSDESYQSAISAGWFPSLPEAIDGFLNDTTPATRAELEAKAKELGIPFTAKTKDSKLEKLINDVLTEDADDVATTTEAATETATTEQAAEEVQAGAV